MKLSKSEINTVRIALGYAIQWESEYLDVVSDSKCPSDIDAAKASKKNIRRYHRLLKKIHQPKGKQ